MKLEFSSDCCSWQKTAKRRLRLISLNEMPQAESDTTTITETTTTAATKMKSFVPGEDIEDDHLLLREEDRTRSSSEEKDEEIYSSREREKELYNDQEYFYCDENSNQINSNQIKQRSCHYFNKENITKSSERLSQHNYNKNNNKSSTIARFTTLHLFAVFIGLIINHLGEHSLQANGSFPPPPSLLSQQQANSIGGLQQSMAQMLQTFNGNDSLHLEANHFKLLERDGDFLLVGARNVVYNLSLSTMREVRRLEWPSSDEDIKVCQVKGKSPEQCQNYIRVLKLKTPDTLFVCGTNAYKPRCRTYLITSNAYELFDDVPGEGACPYQENQNVTSLFADGELYSATAAQFSGIDGLIHRTPLRTEQFNPKQLNLPNFVSSFRYGEHVYFLFRESAIEHINCGKTIYSRIARVCINDSGGLTRASRERWTSFVKARLNCSIPGEYPFYFDEIQASTHIVSSNIGSFSQKQQQQQQSSTNTNSDLLYAVFTTPTNSIGGSAVCAFRMSDILAAFDGPFKSQADTNSNWLPVPESKVPQPRPGSCVNDSKKLPDENINFIKDNPLMDTAIEAIWSQPLVMMASINFRFTQIVVDPQVETTYALGSSNMRTDVIFVSTDDGRVFKLINTHHLFISQHQQRGFSNSNMQAAAYSYTSAAAAAQHHQQQQQQVFSPSQLRYTQSHYHQQDNNNNQFPINRPIASAQVMANIQQQAHQQEPLPDVSSGTIVIEELHLFDSRTPILNMLIHYPSTILDTPNSQGSQQQQQQQQQPQYPKLIVLASKQLKAIPLNRCERALTCSDCIALYDPYCAWDTRQQACLGVGRSLNTITSTSSSFTANFNNNNNHLLRNQYNPLAQAQQSNWFPPNNLANNFTISWWLQCPQLPEQQQQVSQVGVPFRSLFSSHLQVPSRFDYASGHHLSHTALVSLSSVVPQQQLVQNNNAASQQPIANSYLSRPQQPVSECLTFCGGVYTPNSLTAAAAGGSHQTSAQASEQSSQLMMNCADFVQQHYIGTGGGGGLTPNSGLFNIGGGGGFSNINGNSAIQQTGNLYTSENLYFAVIICAAFSLILGLVFGFAIGKNSKKHDSSICSSTLDETNLYMASTNLHHGNNSLFAHQQRLHHPLLQQVAGNGLLSTNSNIIRPNLSNQPIYNDANQCLLNDNGQSNYSNSHQQQQQQQMLLQLIGLTNSSNIHNKNSNNNSVATTNTSHLNNNNSSVRSGALPPLPVQQAPLVNTSTSSTHINHSQLTPNSINSSINNHQLGTSITSKTSSTNTSSCSSSTVPVSDHHHQLYLNQQQLLMQPNHHQQQQPQNINSNNSNSNNIHQRSFTNGSSNNSSIGKCSNRLTTDSTTNKLSSNGKNNFLQQQQQQLQQVAPQQQFL